MWTNFRHDPRPYNRELSASCTWVYSGSCYYVTRVSDRDLTKPTKRKAKKITNYTIISYVEIYIPMLEGIMHDSKGSALCLLTLGHISVYNMDNTILLLLLYFTIETKQEIIKIF